MAEALSLSVSVKIEDNPLLNVQFFYSKLINLWFRFGVRMFLLTDAHVQYPVCVFPQTN